MYIAHEDFTQLPKEEIDDLKEKLLAQGIQLLATFGDLDLRCSGQRGCGRLISRGLIIMKLTLILWVIPAPGRI